MQVFGSIVIIMFYGLNLVIISISGNERCPQVCF